MAVGIAGHLQLETSITGSVRSNSRDRKHKISSAGTRTGGGARVGVLEKTSGNISSKIKVQQRRFCKRITSNECKQRKIENKRNTPILT